MDLRHLRYFIAVAEEQNVTRAAARLRVSQPPLTRQIHDLEDEIGVALFERNGRSIRLTEAGKVFLLEAKASVKRVEDAVDTVRSFAAKTVCNLQIGYAPTPTAEVLPKILRKFHESSPQIQVVLHDHSSPEMLRGLREKRLDAAFMMEPAKQSARGIVFEPLRSYRVGIAMSPIHRLVRRKSIAICELLDEPFIAYSVEQFPDYHEFMSRAVGGVVKKKLRIVQECDGGPTLIAAVESGKGVTVAFEVLTASSGSRLRFVPLSSTSTKAVIGIAHRSGHLSPELNALIAAARAN